MGKKLISFVKYIFFLGLGAGLFWLSIRQLDLHEVWLSMLGADYWWMLLALFFAIISHIVRALRWNLLIGTLGYKTRLSSTFFAVMVGYLANTAVPRMGEFARCGVLSKKEKIPFNALFGTVISERFFDLITLMLIIFLVIIFQMDLLRNFLDTNFWPFFDNLFSNINSIILFGIIAAVILGGIIWLVWVFKNKIKAMPFYHRIVEFLRGLWDGIKSIKNMQHKWLFVFYTIIIWLFYILMTYIPLKMLAETSDLTFLDGLTLMAIASLGIVAPVPGGIGAYHYLVKVTLTELWAVEANAAMSFATISHAAQTLMNVVVGAISYFLLIISAKKQPPLNE